MTGPEPTAHRRVEMTNALGLHLRAADKFARTAGEFQAEIHVSRDGSAVNGKSILDLTTLAAECGTWLDLKARGSDAEAALVALAELVAASFHEASPDSTD